MSLKVYDFYTKDKISTNRYHNILMNGTLFYILVKMADTFKELDLQIPKKYHYEQTYFNYIDFSSNKVIEYNILFDFVKSNENLIKNKWGLSDEEFYDLRDGLKLALVREHSTCGFPRNVILETTVLFNFFVTRFLRRIVG